MLASCSGVRLTTVAGDQCFHANGGQHSAMTGDKCWLHTMGLANVMASDQCGLHAIGVGLTLWCATIVGFIRQGLAYRCGRWPVLANLPMW